MSESQRDVSFLLFFCLLLLVGAQHHKDPGSLCASQQTCEECLQTPRCVWCSMPNLASRKPLIRCVTREKHIKEGELWCDQSHVVDNFTPITFVKNVPLSSGKDPVQVQPQRIRLNLRKGEEYKFILKYTQAEDYPVDLYYLMDLSTSMRKYRDHLSNIGLKIAEAMSKLTSNFRLGFGSFVDKVVLPMTNTHPEKLKAPCQLDSQTYCAPPYGFKNQMPLMEDITLFRSYVMKAPISGNVDTPEGGFDALMQAMVCTEKIKWRPNARHLIVFSTDASFHLAGDGKLAGIVEPNDCLCHLDEEGFYSYSLLQDYPSVAQIHKKSREFNMNIIFALAQNNRSSDYRIYEQLSNIIRGSSIGTMIDNGQNVVTLISKEYEKLVSSIILVDNKPSLIDVKYFSRCLDLGGKLMERQECGGLRVGDVIEFEIVVKAVDCPANQEERKQILEIKPRGINESLTVEIEILCSCNCKSDPSDRPAETCKGHGTLHCGICSCEEGFYGKQCECKGHEFGSGSGNVTEEDCKASNTSTEICSGHGACICGVCDCAKRPNPQEVFYGKYCECDNFSCKRSEGQICGGRGKCECGRCNCLPGWSGETCDCQETNSTCIPSTMTMESSEESVKICSGRGDCICGSCHCHEKDNIRYSGRYCEECPTCPGQKCEELKNCVECLAYGTGPYAESGKCINCMHDLTMVDVIKEDPENDQTLNAHICRTPGDGGCSFVFKYEHDIRGGRGDIEIYTIFAQKERECPVPIDIMGVALGVIISTIFLGLLVLLTWKVLTTIHDKKEYEKFERERALARWDRGDNPLYKGATTTFNNPTFNEST
ncbi:hypothetical protein KPH14_005497 [Odynerus spinipes]|uniref:Integrin beta n=1 Tax=Odynerus spinipes TaxID=1348599 RepID=A0AAD9RBW8_9HYME|nr:hypothetical protein KPH14_005497 [Odynerus spinipes]